jgi:hypothetical protein
MKLVMTLVVRDEVDVIDTQLSYHLNAGVDFVIASDHESKDGTTDLLEAHAREGHLRIVRRNGPIYEDVWRTEMARLAATEYGADWVINTDADEFWMPRGATLVDVLSAVPREYGVVWGLSRHFVPRPDHGEDFIDRMVTRLSLQAPINDPTSPYRPHAKAAHRGAADIVVRHGAHIAYSPSLRPLRDWYPADVLHFPFRSREQYERKGVRRAHGDKPLGQYVRAWFASTSGHIASVFDSLVVDDETCRRGLDSRILVTDMRLRDAMRTANSGKALHGRLHRENSSMAEHVEAVTEGSALRDADLVRVRRRLDELAVRVARLDRRPDAQTR